MYGKWMCFLVLIDLVIIAYSTPGQFYLDFNSGNDKSIWGQAWRGWGHDWYSGYTTKRAKTKVKTTVSRRASRRSTTPPQPTISDVEIRLGELITTSVAPSSQSVQAEQDKHTLEPFAPRPEDGGISVAVASVKIMPDASSPQLVKADALADQKTLQALAPGPTDTDTSTVKTIPDAPSSQLVKAEALADQKMLKAFAPGPKDTDTSTVKTMPDAPSFQLVKAKALAEQKMLKAFAPGRKDTDTSTVKTMPDASSSQLVKAEALADQKTLQAFAPGPENTEISTVKTIPDAPSPQLVKADALADQKTLQAFAPGPKDTDTSTVKTMPDAPSPQLVKAEALADQKTLKAFAPGPEDTETSTVKAMPDAPSSQLVKAEAFADQKTLKAFALSPEETVKTMLGAPSPQLVKVEGPAGQQTLQAFAPGPKDTDTSTVKIIPDAPSPQLVKAEALADQKTLQAFAPGPKDTGTSTVKTTPDALSPQFVKIEGPADQQTLQGFAPSSEDWKTSAWQSLKRWVGTSFQSLQDLTEKQKADALYKAQNFGPDGEYENLKRLLDDATVKPEASGLEAKPDRKTSLWHVAVYKLRIDTSGRSECCDLVCGGSLVKEYIVVSAAHCFWSIYKGVPRVWEPEFKVAAGKLHPGYYDPRDTGAQYSDVEKIIRTEVKRPLTAQPDLAVITLATPFKYTDAVKPVCVNFFWEDEQQLRKGINGTVASWALRKDRKCLPMPSESLFWLSLPFVEPDACQVPFAKIMPNASVRICAGGTKDVFQCDIDGGNGLVFYQGTVPYLRGVTIDSYLYQDTTIIPSIFTRSFADIIIPLQQLLKKINDSVNLEECEDMYRTNATEAPKTTVTEDYGIPFPTAGPEEAGIQFGIQAIGASPVPVLKGTSAPAYQWHVGIYSKAWVPYMQICGGTLVKRDFVISAAHCFWDDTVGQQPASQFAVAAGKLFRPWNNTQDTSAQHSNVSRIILPVRFRGSATSFQDDIAILRLSNPFTYTPGVQPACLSFNATFERMQLQPNWRGRVLGWGLTEENGRPSQRLNYLDLPYVDVEDCFTESDPAFMKFITSDKICAGDTTSGYALCRGDSGGGYVIHSDATPYLHGVASTAAGNQNLCNAFALAAITSTYSHRGFIRENIPDIEEDCAGDTAGTGNLETGNRESGKEASTGNAGLIGNVGTGNEGSTANAGLVGNIGTGNEVSTENTRLVENIGTGNLGSTGNVGTGNQGLNVIGGTPGNAVGATPVFSQLPYYPNHFVCNCNCKP